VPNAALVLSPTSEPTVFLAADGSRCSAPLGWAYVVSFEVEILSFLRFAPRFEALARTVARQVTEHATPVGSGTVARTKRIPIERRAESAVIAWMRHQTTAYDQMKIARIKGERREVRRELATISRAVLDLHRRDHAHTPSACPLCAAVLKVAGLAAGAT
jgi:Uncharacterized conserved protein (DUF2293)